MHVFFLGGSSQQTPVVLCGLFIFINVTLRFIIVISMHVIFFYLLCKYISRALPLFYSVTPNIRSIVYKYGMMNGGSPEDWDTMWNRYKVETVPQEQIKLLYGMANTNTMWLLVRFVNFSHVCLHIFWSNTQVNVY